MNFDQVLAELAGSKSDEHQDFQSWFRTNRYRMWAMMRASHKAAKATGTVIGPAITKTSIGSWATRWWYRECLFTISGTTAELQVYFRLAERIYRA